MMHNPKNIAHGCIAVKITETSIKNFNQVSLCSIMNCYYKVETRNHAKKITKWLLLTKVDNHHCKSNQST
jgi:hypothetical protein